MRLGPIGGALIVIASALVLVAAAIAVGGGPIVALSASPGGLAVTAAVILLGVGLGLLAIAGRSPLDGRLVRSGLLILAIGLLVATASSSAQVDSMLIVALLIGGALAWIGGIATAVGLLLTPGRPRQIGLVFGAGLVLAMAGATLTSQTIAGMLLGVLGAGALLAGVAAIGLLALRSARPVEAAAG